MKPGNERATVSGWASGRKIKEQLIFMKNGGSAKLAHTYSRLEMIRKGIMFWNYHFKFSALFQKYHVFLFTLT